jgi:hypothetical protein
MELLGYLSVLGYFRIENYVSEQNHRYKYIYLKHYKRRETRAASRIYFWWIRRCFDMSAPSGIRMCLASLARHEALVAL